MPWIRRRVVCGLSETIATLPPASALTSVDLPTFGRPATATKPDLIRTSRVRERPPRGRPPPDKGWGCRPATHTVERTPARGAQAGSEPNPCGPGARRAPARPSVTRRGATPRELTPAGPRSLAATPP